MRGEQIRDLESVASFRVQFFFLLPRPFHFLSRTLSSGVLDLDCVQCPIHRVDGALVVFKAFNFYITPVFRSLQTFRSYAVSAIFSCSIVEAEGCGRPVSKPPSSQRVCPVPSPMHVLSQDRYQELSMRMPLLSPLLF